MVDVRIAMNDSLLFHERVIVGVVSLSDLPAGPVDAILPLTTRCTMPSPFPGMDPWLESPDIWPGFHDKLINETVRIMQPQLRARGYYIDSGERVWLAEPGRLVVPDDVVFSVQPSSGAKPGDNVAIMDADEPIRVKREPVEVRETYAEIFDARGHQLVTGIEFLSPTNKSDGHGRQLYQRKQQELAAASINLVEIDLIRGG